MFIDEVKVYARAGKGGRGCVAFLREASRPKGGPSGGNGGRGGDVILQADHDINNLIAQFFSPKLIAQDGEHGMGKGMDGHAGKHLVIQVPCGTLIWKLPPDQAGPEPVEPGLSKEASEPGTVGVSQIRGELVVDLTENGQQWVLCKGGRGGLGNRNFATARRQTPRFAQPGEPGEEGMYWFELRIMAEVGLTGYPNAGKSTLLAAISKARPKIAPYPFTTLHPQIGIVEYEDHRRLTVCDVPGIIEGAHRNVGLGHAFLRHIQRCRILVLLLDMAGTDGRKPWDDYRHLLEELKCYDPALFERPRMIVANKMDEPPARENLKMFKRKVRKTPVLEMAAGLGEGVEAFKVAMREAVLAS